MSKEDEINDILYTVRQRTFRIFHHSGCELMQLELTEEEAGSKVKAAILEALEENS